MHDILGISVIWVLDSSTWLESKHILLRDNVCFRSREACRESGCKIFRTCDEHTEMDVGFLV